MGIKMRKFKFIVLFCFTLLLGACSSSEERASKMRLESVALFDSGNIKEATKLASKLSSLDPFGSRLLLGQYEIYADLAAKKDLVSHVDIRPAYSSLTRLGDKVDRGDDAFNIVAQTYAITFLRGELDAENFFKSECNKLMGMNEDDCFNVISQQIGGEYFKNHSRFYAIFFYELSTVGGELKLIDDANSRFYVSMALMKINDDRSILMLKALQSSGLLDQSMFRTYCRYMTRENPESDCNKMR